MKNFKRKLSALVLSTLFASMQVSYAVIDTGLGANNGGATINNITGGYAGISGAGTGNVDLNFNGNAHVNWNTLNVNKGESLNFNATNGATGLTVLNTVNQGMSNIYGQINANQGISQLIISNPNGVLFDGAQFTTAGDAMITTQPMTATFVDGVMKVSNVATNDAVGVIKIQDSNINVGGEFNILAPAIGITRGTVKTANGMKLVTANGQDYLAAGNLDTSKGVRLETVNIDGDVYVIADKGVVKTVGGGEIKGNLNVKSDDSVALNYVANGKALHVTGDVDVEGNGVLMYARNTKVDGNLNMTNGGGFLEVGNVQVGKDMNLKTVAKSENPQGYKHFVHVVGNNKIGGNATIEAKEYFTDNDKIDYPFLRYNSGSPRFACYRSKFASGLLRIYFNAKTSGVEKVALTDKKAKVYGANGNIVVEAETAADVNVYNAAGMLVAAQKVGAGRTNITLAKGFYVVRAGNTVTKVAVR